MGKTFISLTLAAAITRGWPLLSQTGAPGDELEPADVLCMSAEDGLADTLRPRLDAADADVSRVHALTGWRLDDGDEGVEGTVSLGDIPILEQALVQTKAKLIIIDPLQAYLGAGVDMHRANEVRPLLSALGNLAEKYGCAVICIRHLSKAMSPKAIYSGMGSIDFAAAARSILMVGEHDGERMLAHVKSSLAPQGKSILYELRDGSLNWLGISDVTAEELRVPQKVESEGSTLEAAVVFSQNFLGNGPQPANATFKAAQQEGISSRTLKRAKAQLEVKSQRASAGNEGEGQWLWSLLSSGTLAPLRAEPVPEANFASGPRVLVKDVAPLPKEREEHEKPKEGKEAKFSLLEADDLSRYLDSEKLPGKNGQTAPPEVAELRRRWVAGELKGIVLKIPGGKVPDFERTAEAYFAKTKLTEAERDDLLGIARAALNQGGAA